MALQFFVQATDTKGVRTMQGTTKQDEPAKRPAPPQGRGTPSTGAVHSQRKDVTVRLSVSTPNPESEVINEHGYGQGV